MPGTTAPRRAAAAGRSIAATPEFPTIGYRDAEIRRSAPTGFKHTGLFPEQAVNWDFPGRGLEKAGRPIRVLNLFAYTGGATLACAAAGASVCHVDASKGMVAWARENQQLSGLGEKPIQIGSMDDCQKFVERENPPGQPVRWGHYRHPPATAGARAARYGSWRIRCMTW